jgi:hypothetical protein
LTEEAPLAGIADPTSAALDPKRPLLIVDVDEVLALFMLGFGAFLQPRGYEMRVDRFALFQNIYRPGEDQHLDIETGRRLFDDFFRFGHDDLPATPHAADSLRALAEHASIVILTNAPDHGREPRAAWLKRHGMAYPLVINQGPKGEAVSILAARTRAPVAFVDDLLPNLESAAQVAPAVHRFQLVADERLRKLAPCAPDRHARFDDWRDLRGALAKTLEIDRA